MSGRGAVLYAMDRPLEPEHPYFTQEDGPETEGKPVQYIANLTKDSVAGFKYFRLDHVRSVSVWLRGDGAGRLMVSTGVDDPAAIRIPVRPTEEWTKYTASYAPPDGVSQLSFVFTGEGAVDFLKFELE